MGSEGHGGRKSIGYNVAIQAMTSSKLPHNISDITSHLAPSCSKFAYFQTLAFSVNCLQILSQLKNGCFQPDHEFLSDQAIELHTYKCLGF